MVISEIPCRLCLLLCTRDLIGPSAGQYQAYLRATGRDDRHGIEQQVQTLIRLEGAGVKHHRCQRRQAEPTRTAVACSGRGHRIAGAGGVLDSTDCAPRFDFSHRILQCRADDNHDA
jgi:hypothetical protein